MDTAGSMKDLKEKCFIVLLFSPWGSSTTDLWMSSCLLISSNTQQIFFHNIN